MVVGAHGLVIHLVLSHVAGGNRPDKGFVIIPHPRMAVQVVVGVLPIGVPATLMLVQPALVQVKQEFDRITHHFTLGFSQWTVGCLG